MGKSAKKKKSAGASVPSPSEHADLLETRQEKFEIDVSELRRCVENGEEPDLATWLQQDVKQAYIYKPDFRRKSQTKKAIATGRRPSAILGAFKQQDFRCRFFRLASHKCSLNSSNLRRCS